MSFRFPSSLFFAGFFAPLPILTGPPGLVQRAKALFLPKRTFERTRHPLIKSNKLSRQVTSAVNGGVNLVCFGTTAALLFKNHTFGCPAYRLHPGSPQPALHWLFPPNFGKRCRRRTWPAPEHLSQILLTNRRFICEALFTAVIATAG